MTKELLQSALDLARLDGAYRATRSYIDNPPKEFGSSDSRDIEDLEALFKLIPSRFLNLSNLLLNPTFGGASALVGGADADLIIGKTLIDIKTVKKFTLEVGYWRQLVGYAILADLANDASFEVIIPPFVEKAEIPNLDEVGIYFSRYGEVWAFPTSNIYEHEGYQKFKKWFVQEATKKYMVVTSWEGAMEETSWEGARMESEARRNLRSNPVEFVKNKSSFRRILEIVRDKHVRRSKLSERLGVKRSTLRKYLGDLRSAGLTKKDPSGKPKNALVKITERGEAVESKVRSEN